jgi:hypothetical protein
MPEKSATPGLVRLTRRFVDNSDEARAGPERLAGERR